MRLLLLACVAFLFACVPAAAHHRCWHHGVCPTPTPTATPTATPTPTPTSTPEPSACPDWSCGFDTWDSTLRIWPSKDWRPFAAADIFNMRVPAAPLLDPNSATKMARMRSFSSTGAQANISDNPPADYGHPYVFAKDIDRVLTIDCVRYGVCAGIDGVQVHVPANAQPANGSDSHLSIIEGKRIVDIHRAGYYVGGVIPQSGTWPVGAGALYSMDGASWTSNPNPGATAANFSAQAGVVRGAELQAGVVAHQMFGSVSCVTGSVYPVTRQARQCSSIGLPTDGPALGDWIYLAMTDAELASLTYASGAPLHRSMRTLLTALAHYGSRLGDTGGTYSLMGVESPRTYTPFGVASPVRAVANAEGWVVYNDERLLRPRDLPSWVWDRLRVIHPCVSDPGC